MGEGGGGWVLRRQEGSKKEQIFDPGFLQQYALQAPEEASTLTSGILCTISTC